MYIIISLIKCTCPLGANGNYSLMVLYLLQKFLFFICRKTLLYLMPCHVSKHSFRGFRLLILLPVVFQTTVILCLNDSMQRFFKWYYRKLPFPSYISQWQRICFSWCHFYLNLAFFSMVLFIQRKLFSIVLINWWILFLIHLHSSFIYFIFLLPRGIFVEKKSLLEKLDFRKSIYFFELTSYAFSTVFSSILFRTHSFAWN